MNKALMMTKFLRLILKLRELLKKDKKASLNKSLIEPSRINCSLLIS